MEQVHLTPAQCDVRGCELWVFERVHAIFSFYFTGWLPDCGCPLLFMGLSDEQPVVCFFLEQYRFIRGITVGWPWGDIDEVRRMDVE